MKKNTKESEITSLEKVALQATLKLNNEQLDNVLTVCLATADFRKAVEILCGVYVEPEIGTYGIIDYAGNNCAAKFISFNPFTEKVEYSFRRQITNRVYCPNGMEQKELQERVDEFAHMSRSEVEEKHGGYDYHFIVTDPDHMMDDHDDCRLSTWINCVHEHENLAMKKSRQLHEDIDWNGEEDNTSITPGKISLSLGETKALAELKTKMIKNK